MNPEPNYLMGCAGLAMIAICVATRMLINHADAWLTERRNMLRHSTSVSIRLSGDQSLVFAALRTKCDQRFLRLHLDHLHDLADVGLVALRVSGQHEVEISVKLTKLGKQIYESLFGIVMHIDSEEGKVPTPKKTKAQRCINA